MIDSWRSSIFGWEPGDPSTCERTNCKMHAQYPATFPFGFLDKVFVGDFGVATEAEGVGARKW